MAKRRICGLSLFVGFGLLASLWWIGVPTGAADDPKETPAEKYAINEAPPGILKRIDNGFGKAVDAIDAVLFYRIGAGERESVNYKKEKFYWRPYNASDPDASKEQPFQELNATDSPHPKQLSEKEMKRQAALGKLAAGADGNPVVGLKVPLDEEGKPETGGRDVQYVSIKIPHANPKIEYDATYVKTVKDGETIWGRLKVFADRETVSDEDTLTEEQVAQLLEEKVFPEIKKSPSGGAPVVVLWLALGAISFTIWMGFFNFRGFRHSLQIVRGKYDNPNEAGEVTHFQALASALSATVGLGNIAGVAVAMMLGGPGAFFWMLMCGLFGMSSKFVECTLGQKYRLVKPDGSVQGGPMRYLHLGLKELKLGTLGVALSVIFTIMCLLASFGGGNMFQANQSGEALLQTVQAEDRKALRGINNELAKISKRVDALPAEIAEAAAQNDAAKVKELREEQANLETQIGELPAERAEKQKAASDFEFYFRIAYGLILATFVGLVIIGGIRRIGKWAEKIVPTMCLLYVAMCIWVIGNHITEVPGLFADIFTSAFAPGAMFGGFIGVLILGVQRAAFSNEAGVGSAAIAHSAAKTEEPVREGCVALLEPFIDTIVVCSMTALVILMTGVLEPANNPDGLVGAPLTGFALGEEVNWFPWILSAASVLFAFSTIISWSYYGERSWEQLFGPRSVTTYKVLAVICVFLGANFQLGRVLAFSDYMILSMALPNILGLLLLAPKVRKDLDEYWRRYKNNEFVTYK